MFIDYSEPFDTIDHSKISYLGIKEAFFNNPF